MATDVAPGAASGYQRLSLWWEAVPAPLPPRPALTQDLQVDVCIVGAGFTGLWTAHSLALADPALRIAVVEREVAGFGASGRNGGWCSALFATSDAALARLHGLEAMRAMRTAMQETIGVVGETAASEGIECHFAKGGSVDLVRSEAQRVRALAAVDDARELGFGEDDVRWLGPDEARELIGADGILGATFTPHCAALQPALLARGLADAVERRGVQLYEHTEVLDIVPGSGASGPSVVTSGGTVDADVVVRATEAWTPSLPGFHRDIVPVYSLMVATEPLDDAFWSSAGLESRATFADHRHMIIYGQRTADGRIAFGGRGAPYHFGSAVRSRYDTKPAVHALLRRTLTELFPELESTRFTHAWGGPLGIPRDWHSSVGLDRGSGLAWAGGYVGDGVATTNLAGRTLADLITGADSELVALPWVDHRSPRWEPEPLRWLGVNAGLWAMKLADRSEARRGRPSRVRGRDGAPPRPVISATISPVEETAAEAITKLIYSYAERIDAGDFAGVAQLLAHATLTFEGFGDAVSGPDAIERLYARSTRRYEDGTPRTKHVMTNVMVDVADDGATASSRSYFTVLQAVPGALALQPVIAGRYRHTYERVNRQWRVATMHITIDLVGDLGHHMLFDLAP